MSVVGIRLIPGQVVRVFVSRLAPHDTTRRTMRAVCGYSYIAAAAAVATVLQFWYEHGVYTQAWCISMHLNPIDGLCSYHVNFILVPLTLDCRPNGQKTSTS